MSQQLIVQRLLKFIDSAQSTGNIEGRPSYRNQVVWVDDFTGKAIDSTNDYTFAGVNSGTATITVPHCLTITTGAADDDDGDFAMGIDFYGQYNIAMEVRFRNDDVSGLAVNIGFSDAQGEAADLIAMTYSGTTLTSTASEFAGFLFDPDATTDNIYAVSTKANADGSVINSSSAPADSDWYTIRVELRDNGSDRCDAIFYVNTSGKEIDPGNDVIGMEIDAVTRDTALCPYIASINREAAANTLDVDYIKVWSDRQ